MNKINNIIILAGGLGKRLGKITKKTPKPLIEFNRIPFLDIQINNFSKLNPEKIIILCRYKSIKFKKKYQNKKINNTIIKCIVEKKVLGTGGALENAKKYIVNNTLICNGDTFFNYNFNKFKKYNLKNNIGMMFLVENKNYKSNKKLSNISIKNNKIVFAKKRGMMNSGFYLVNKKIIKYLKKGSNSFENEILPKIIMQKKIYGKICKNNIHIDIGTKKNLNYLKTKCKTKSITKNIKLI